jgi:hypothetical protein
VTIRSGNGSADDAVVSFAQADPAAVSIRIGGPMVGAATTAATGNKQAMAIAPR